MFRSCDEGQLDVDRLRNACRTGARSSRRYGACDRIGESELVKRGWPAAPSSPEDVQPTLRARQPGVDMEIGYRARGIVSFSQRLNYWLRSGGARLVSSRKRCTKSPLKIKDS